MSDKYLNQVKLKGTVTPSSSAIAAGDTGHTVAEKIQGQTNTINAVTGIIYGNGTSLQTAIVANYPTLNQDTTGSATNATNIAGGTAKQVPYQTNANTTTFMAAANNAVLNTNGSGVPSLATTLSAVSFGNVWATDPTTGSGSISVSTILSRINAAANIVPLKKGGTGANITANNGGIIFSNATTGQIAAGTATANCLLRSAVSSVGSWGTYAYPSTSTSQQVFYNKNGVITGVSPIRWSVLKYTASTHRPSFTNTVPATVNIGTANCTDPTTSSTASINTALSNLNTQRQGLIPTTYTGSGTITPNSTITTKQAITGASVTLPAATYVIFFSCDQNITSVSGDIGVNLSSLGFVWNTTAGSVITASSFPCYSAMVVNGTEVFSGTFSIMLAQTFAVTTTLDCYAQFINGTASGDTCSATANICAYAIG